MNRFFRTVEFTKRKGKKLFIPTLVLATSLGFSALANAQLETKERVSDRKASRSNTIAKKTEQAELKRVGEPSKFLRVTNDAAGNPLAMQTAITRYRPNKGDLVIDLIGAVHIGEGDYFRQLNNQFKHYDVVLYELVAPQGTRVPRGGKKKSNSQSPLNIVSWMQSQTQSTLGLESQLEMIRLPKRELRTRRHVADGDGRKNGRAWRNAIDGRIERDHQNDAPTKSRHRFDQ